MSASRATCGGCLTAAGPHVRGSAGCGLSHPASPYIGPRTIVGHKRGNFIGVVILASCAASVLCLRLLGEHPSLGAAGATQAHRASPGALVRASEAVAVVKELRIPDKWESQPVRLRLHVFDPDFFAIDDPRIQTMITQLNHDYRWTNVRFIRAGLEMHPHTPYDVLDSVTEEADMKAAFADAPADQVNIFIVRQIKIPVDRAEDAPEASANTLSSAARTDPSGIVLDGDYIGAGHHLLSREVAHFLGQ